jgi:hypothetical protein
MGLKPMREAPLRSNLIRVLTLSALSLFGFAAAGCQESCSNHDDCSSDQYCWAGACKDMGEVCRKPCAVVDDCGAGYNGYCIGGYCYGSADKCSCQPCDPCSATASECVGTCETNEDCSDSNACTEDTCLANQCVHTPVIQLGCCLGDGDCDDQNPCTKDRCQDNQCVFPTDPEAGCCQTHLDCDDGDPCTEDTCADDGRCLHGDREPGCCLVDPECDDMDPCSVDRCVNHLCVHPHTENVDGCACVSAGDCEDANPCSRDSCVDGACVYTLDPAGVFPGAECCGEDAHCEDGNHTTLDRCEEFVCGHSDLVPCVEPVDCFGIDPCAIYECRQGYCQVQQQLDDCCAHDFQCDDEDDCTTDACDGNVCSHDFVKNPGCCESAGDCNDGESCTLDLCCEEASCQTSDGPVQAHHCFHQASGAGCCVSDSECKDDNKCTEDVCDDYQCVHESIPECCYFDEQCEDDVACTEDRCVDAQCQNIAAPDCCLSSDDCDDDDPCTQDYCISNGCTHEEKSTCCLVDEECPSSDPCKVGACVDAKCVYSNAENCCAADADCDDGDGCTHDLCLANACVHTPVTAPDCCVPTEILTDDFEIGAPFQWTIQNTSNQVGWAVDGNGVSQSGAQALRYTGPGGSYQTPGNPNAGTALSSSMILPYEEDISIRFSLIADVRSDPAVDQLTLSIHDGEDVIPVWDRSDLPGGASSQFTTVAITSDAFAGETIRLKLDFDTVDAPPAGGVGVVIDDLIIGYGCAVGAVTCASDDDCLDGDPCSADTCVEGTCGVTHLSEPGCCGAPVLATELNTVPPNASLSPSINGVTWILSEHRHWSPPTSMYFGNPVTHTYDAGADTAAIGSLTLDGVDLTGMTQPVLAFQVWMNVEQYPFVDHFGVSVEGAELWNKKTDAPDLPGPTGWMPVTVDLSAYADQIVSVVFHFDSKDGNSNGYEGVYIDDLVVGEACP